MERLNKYLAHAGVGSRRHCDTLIAAGRVKVDGVPVSDLGLKVNPETHAVSVDDQPVKAERAVYWAVNKPVGYLSTNSDPDGRPRAVELLDHVEQRVYTVGRLDEASEGLLLMTNDGKLAFHLTHPRYGIPKTYQALVAGSPSPADLQKLLDGVWISDGRVKAQAVRRLKPQGDSTWLRVVLTEGKNREIRRMLAGLGHKVLKLRRVAIGPVRLDKLPKGKSRRLGETEVVALRAWVKTAQEKLARKGAKVEASGGRQTPDGVTNQGVNTPRSPKPGFAPRPPQPGFAPRPPGRSYPKPAGFRPGKPTGYRPEPFGPKPQPLGPKPFAAPATGSRKPGRPAPLPLPPGFEPVGGVKPAYKPRGAAARPAGTGPDAPRPSGNAYVPAHRPGGRARPAGRPYPPRPPRNG